MRTTLFAVLAVLILVAGCSLKTQGGMAMSRRDYPRAIELYTQAMTEDPSDMFAKRKLGQALFYKGDYAPAETQFRESLVKIPNDWFSTFYLGLSLIGRGERDQGFDVLAGYKNLWGHEEQRLVLEAVASFRAKTEMPVPEVLSGLEQALAKAQDAQVQYDRDSASDGGIGGRNEVKYLTPM